MPQKGILDPNLEKLIEGLRANKEAAAQARSQGAAVPNMTPPRHTWTGGLQTTQDIIDLAEAFNTDEAQEALKNAFTPGDPGNSSDGVTLTLQIDYAAQAERAYRARTAQTFPRMVAHLAGRERGHGTATGPLAGQATEYFTSILKQGSSGAEG